jgi:hypothetical protein
VLETAKQKIEKKQIDITHMPKIHKIASKVVKKTSSTSAKRRTNLKSLFANVKVSAKKVKKTKVLNVKQSSIASRFKSKFEKEKKTKKLVLSDLVQNKQKTQIRKLTMQANQNETDPYYSKIYKILSSRWTPTFFADDLKAKVLVIITNKGEFNFKFIQYSNNDGFDTQLMEFLKNETKRLYPINPNNKIVTIEITFQSKG